MGNGWGAGLMHSGNRLRVGRGQHAPDPSVLLWRAGLRAKEHAAPHRFYSQTCNLKVNAFNQNRKKKQKKQ